MIRPLFNLLSALTLLLFIAVCVLWVRGLTGYDQAAWSYDRYLPDRSAASTQVCLSSDKRLWLTVTWGQVGPYTGSLVWGYYIRADQSGGHPRLTFSRNRYDMQNWGFLIGDPDAGTSGLGPLRWETNRRSNPAAGERSTYIRVGVFHWLLALFLLVPPTLWLKRVRQARRARTLGLCSKCGYDLRATPERCPECGTIPTKRVQ